MDETPPEFTVDAARCTACGLCRDDCVVGAIEMEKGRPFLARPDDCLRCQHCLAICPGGAVSIFGLDPADSLPVAAPDAETLRRFMIGRRSFRHFKPGDVPAAELRDLVDTAWNAPTGVNARALHFSLLSTAEAMARFRAACYDRIESELARTDRKATDSDESLAEMLADWRAGGRDDIFRAAPHLVVVSYAAGSPCGAVDSVIALSYLELYAQARGLGTVWCGLAMMFFAAMRSRDLLQGIGVPKGHKPGYAMLLGRPVRRYPRGVQRGAAPASFVV